MTTKPRLLVFSPYQLWTIHTIYEGTIAKACQVRGATVEYLLCDGLLPECDQHWDSKEHAPRSSDLCQRCQKAATVSLDDLDLPYRWLGEFVTAAEKAEAFAWAQSVTPGEFRETSFKGTPLGSWVLSSVISYFRQYPPDLTNLHVVNVFRGFLVSAAIVATGLSNYLEANPVDAALLFNGRQSITRVALELFQQRGIRVLTHERAEYQRGHINVRPGAHCMSPVPFKNLWSMWADVSLNRESLDAALKWLIQRRYGANLAWIPFNKVSNANTSIRKRLCFNQNKRLWALFTSSTDEVAGDPLMQGPYESQAVWVRDVIEWVSSRDDLQLVIKVHPNLGGNIYIGKAVNELKIYQEMKLALPANVRIVMPEDPISAYSLAEEADVGLTFGSTIGLEMAMMGKPVLLASKALYEHGEQTLTVRSRESLPAMLERCLHASPGREIQREAFRLAYCYLFRFEPPFPAITVLGIYQAKVNYDRPEDLAPGKDSSLDRICNFLLNGSPLSDCPTPDEQSRSTSDEDAFFAELERSPDYLRDIAYERWFRLNSSTQSMRDLVRRLPFGVGDALLSLGRHRWHSLLARIGNRGILSPQHRGPTASYKQPQKIRNAQPDFSNK
jgi:hypothetical protein